MGVSARPPPESLRPGALGWGCWGVVSGTGNPGRAGLRVEDAPVPQNQIPCVCEPQWCLPQGGGGPQDWASGRLSGEPFICLGISALLCKKNRRLGWYTQKQSFPNQVAHHQYLGELAKIQSPGPCWLPSEEPTHPTLPLPEPQFRALPALIRSDSETPQPWAGGTAPVPVGWS